MHGFLVIDKPAGMSSHDVVSRVRRITGIRKAGHTGTLDPFATGVLPVALGEGTKAIPFLDESVKEYLATMVLGQATDTQDCTGRTIHEGEWRHLSAAEVEGAVLAFVGRGRQIPPMFSALKRNGIPLYKLARKGEEVDREARDIEVFSIEIVESNLPQVIFRVRCSRGAYVRTLAHDMGMRLGCGAHLTGLRRIASGPFQLQAATTLERLEIAGENRELMDHLVSCTDALAPIRQLPVHVGGRDRVLHGIAPRLEDLDIAEGGLVCSQRVALCFGETLLAVAENVAESGIRLRLLRVFNLL